MADPGVISEFQNLLYRGAWLGLRSEGRRGDRIRAAASSSAGPSTVWVAGCGRDSPYARNCTKNVHLVARQIERNRSNTAFRRRAAAAHTAGY
jgi:hypothetical protein